MKRTTITITGARGGQGASTVAAAIALLSAGHHRTILTSHDSATLETLLGLARSQDDQEVTARLTLAHGPVIDAAVHVDDAGLITDADAPNGIHLTVLRGPCYLALRTLVSRTGTPPDGIVLLHERGRSLTARDVADVTDVPVVARVPVDESVARCIDAGLLPVRLHRLAAFAALRRYVTRLLAPSEPEISRARTSDHPARGTSPRPRSIPAPTVDTNGTDLPVPQCGTGRGLHVVA